MNSKTILLFSGLVILIAISGCISDSEPEPPIFMWNFAQDLNRADVNNAAYLDGYVADDFVLVAGDTMTGDLVMSGADINTSKINIDADGEISRAGETLIEFIELIGVNQARLTGDIIPAVTTTYNVGWNFGRWDEFWIKDIDASGDIQGNTATFSGLLTADGAIDMGGLGAANNIQWGDSSSRIYMSSTGLFIQSTGGEAGIRLKNDVTANIGVLALLSGVKDHTSYNQGGGLDFYLWENVGAGQNKLLRQYGYITAAGTRKYAEWVVDDNTDQFILRPEDSNITAFNPQIDINATENVIVAEDFNSNGNAFFNDGNITVGSIGSSGTIKMRDTDDAGWTCCSALDGTLVCHIC